MGRIWDIILNRQLGTLYKRVNGDTWDIFNYGSYGRAYKKNGKMLIMYFSRRSPRSFCSILLFMLGRQSYDEYRTRGHQKNEDINTIILVPFGMAMPLILVGYVDKLFQHSNYAICIFFFLFYFILLPLIIISKGLLDYKVGKKTNWSYSSYIELKWAKKRKERLDELRSNRVSLGKEAYMEAIKIEHKKRYKGNRKWLFITTILAILLFIYQVYFVWEK